jgi:hypothetical protein
MSEETASQPGEGPTANVSVSLHAESIAAVRARVGKRGFSAYVEAAVQRQIERDYLRELIASMEEANGPADPAAVEAKRALLRGGGTARPLGEAA